MSGKIKVRCIGSEIHVNEIDLEWLLEPTFVVKGASPASRMPNLGGVEFPFYEDCHYCIGRVIITCEIAEQASE